jgi:RNA polymerase sigma-70 factor (ECF subfamily)
MATELSEYDDADLFAMMRPGRKSRGEAFAELYGRYSSRVYAYCVRFLSDKNEAQDIFQETFVKFYQSAEKDRVMTNVPAFILRIARNLCVNHVRAAKPTTSFEEYMGGFETYDSDKDELLGLIKNALELLPDDYREVFVLREYDGLSYQDIADITDTNINNIKVKIYRAKQKVRDILQPYLKDLEKNS